ncbi:hypothetical protein D3C79_993770 [compost metagenome]
MGCGSGFIPAYACSGSLSLHWLHNKVIKILRSERWAIDDLNWVELWLYEPDLPTFSDKGSGPVSSLCCVVVANLDVCPFRQIL